MTTNEYVRAFAGAFVLISLALGVEASPLFVSKHFLWVTGFVGLNLFQSAFTGLCPLVNILHKLGVKDGPASCGWGRISRAAAASSRRRSPSR